MMMMTMMMMMLHACSQQHTAASPRIARKRPGLNAFWKRGKPFMGLTTNVASALLVPSPSTRPFWLIRTFMPLKKMCVRVA